MKANRPCLVSFNVVLTGLADPTRLISMIHNAIRDNRVPPGLGSVKGFTRHVVKTEVKNDRVKFVASVPLDMVSKVLETMRTLDMTVFALAAMGDLFMGESANVATAIVVYDNATRRFASCSTYQGSEYGKDFLTTGQARALDVAAFFATNFDMNKLTQDNYHPWSGTYPELMKAMGDYLQIGEITIH